jgi:hypothetical protein
MALKSVRDYCEEDGASLVHAGEERTRSTDNVEVCERRTRGIDEDEQKRLSISSKAR